MPRFPPLGWLITWTLFALLLADCLPPQTTTPLTPTLVSTSTQTPIPPTLTPTGTSTPLPTATPEPPGCRKPSEDYTRVEVTKGQTINQRTLAILAHAQ